MEQPPIVAGVRIGFKTETIFRRIGSITSSPATQVTGIVTGIAIMITGGTDIVATSSTDPG
jgi:hypothetical protein